MLLPLTSVVVLLLTAHAVMAADGREGPARWLLEERDVLDEMPLPCGPANDPLSRLV